MIYVIKKDGTKEEFNPQKIVAAVNKSAARILYTFSQEEKDFICRFAKEHAASLGKEEIQIQEMPLRRLGKPVQFGKVPVLGQKQPLLDLAAVGLLFNVVKNPFIGGLPLQVFQRLGHRIQRSHFPQPVFLDQLAFHGLDFGGNAAVGK